MEIFNKLPNLKAAVMALGLALMVMTGCESPEKNITVHLVGDSTMADKPDPANNPERGWGQLLPGIFDERVTVSNHAVNGRSSKSFIDEGRWMKVIEQIHPGDYVLIQFGHNDSKAYDPSRYGNAWSAYRRNLERMVSETLEQGAHPILLSSIVRRKFNEEGTLVDSHGPYPYVARQIALEQKVPFIDLQQMTEDLVAAMGPQASTRLFLHLQPGEYPMYPEGRIDNTHLSVLGATELAALVARSIRDLDLPLADYLITQSLPSRMLLVVGGHSYDTTAFFRLFQSLEGVLVDSVSHPRAINYMRSPHMRAYNLVCFYDFVPAFSPKDSMVFRELTARGIPLLFLHHSLCSAQKWKTYEDMLGGKYIMPEYCTDSTLHSGYAHDLELEINISDPTHPVTLGMSDFTIFDEGYSNIRISGEIIPLLECEDPESSPVMGWEHSYQNSRVVYLMLGHDRQAYENPAFIQLVYNSIRWLTK